ncbi:MAG TPA: LLM class flavin-dependent oxidoreductase [Dehalococcoidia bacterium]|nr:LLM class flavin-dependent oxidoreductase [Dehalococcoidia bacterium]
MQVFGNSIRFGVQLATSRTPYAQYRENWLTCERLGYDIAYVTDHFVFPGTDQGQIPVMESTTLLSAMAAQTSRMRCGFMVLGNTFRYPGVLAKIAVTLDQVSNGRLELGMGAGNGQFEHAQYDIPFYTQGRRLRMLGESLKVVRSLLSNERTSFEGRYYKLHDAICEPKPVQAHVPILIGAVGEGLALRNVAESADIWNFYDSPSLEVYRDKLAVLSQHCRDVGRDANDIRKSMHIKPLVGETEAELDDRAEVQVRARGRRRPEQLTEELLTFVKQGVRDFVFMLDAPADLRSLGLIATKVAPQVRAEAKNL